jgi:hypothetical protein
MYCEPENLSVNNKHFHGCHPPAMMIGLSHLSFRISEFFKFSVRNSLHYFLW